MEKRKEPTRPTHELVIRDGYARTVAGVAWLNEEDKTITIKLSPCVVLSYESALHKTIKLTPLPPEAKPGSATKSTKMKEWKDAKEREEDDDEEEDC